MAKKKFILAAAVLVLGGAAAIAAVGHREGRFGHRGGHHDGIYDLAQGYGQGPQGYGQGQGDTDGRGRGRWQRGGPDGMGGPGSGGAGYGGPRGDRFGGDTGGDRDMRRGWFQRGVSGEDFDTRTRERFARLDRNSDGVIDAGEVEAAMTTAGSERRGRMREWMADRVTSRAMGRADADRDGRTTRAEVLDRVRRDFARMDLDGDGRITEADLPPVMRGRDALKGQGPMGHGGMMGGPMISGLGRLIAADANKDGVITLDEVLAEAGRRFELADRNKDGVLDAADREALTKEMTDYRVRRFMHTHGAKDGRVTREQFFATAKERFAERDFNRDGRIDRQDFRSGRGRGPGAGGRDQGPQAPAKEGPANERPATPERK